jgi:hypothetical protein
MEKLLEISVRSVSPWFSFFEAVVLSDPHGRIA